MLTNDSNSGKSETLKEKHARIVSERPKVNAELLSSLTLDQERFKSSFLRLCEEWWDYWGPKSSMGDLVGKRLVTSTLASHLNQPVILSIIADDLEYFKKHGTGNYNELYCLEFACVCGAEKIIRDFFMADTERKKCLALSKFAIGYALSSGKRELAIFVAQEAAKLGQTDPGCARLYTFGDLDGYQAIENVFTNNQKSPTFTPGKDAIQISPSRSDDTESPSKKLKPGFNQPKGE